MRLLFFYLEDFPLGIGKEGKPAPSRADFPSSIKMCHSFSAAWHHSEMDALGRDREQTLIPTPNTFRGCMECCLNNFISTSATAATKGHRRGQTGWEWGPLSIPSCTYPFMLQEIYNCGLEGRERAHQARVTLHQRISSMGRTEGIWAGKISRHQQAAKGISFKKCPAVSLHKAEIKDTL